MDDSEEEEKQMLQDKEVIQDRWTVIKKLGGGGFGQIYLANDKQMDVVVTVKTEVCMPRDQSQLPMELQVMKRCQGQPHAAALIGAGKHKTLNFIAMQLVGENLGNLKHKSPLEPNRFSMNAVLRLGMQGLEAIRDLHSIGVLHRDIKPTNFAMGLDQTDLKDTVFILDFGLSKFFRDAGGSIRKERSRAGFRGTMRYCSIASHERKDLGRKDDCLSLFYVLYEFWRGQLPWRALTTHTTVLESKKIHTVTKMAANLHEQMERFVKHLENLRYSDAPAYDFLIAVLDFIFRWKRYKMTHQWDWENKFYYLHKEETKSRTTGSKSGAQYHIICLFFVY